MEVTFADIDIALLLGLILAAGGAIVSAVALAWTIWAHTQSGHRILIDPAYSLKRDNSGRTVPSFDLFVRNVGRTPVSLVNWGFEVNGERHGFRTWESPPDTLEPGHRIMLPSSFDEIDSDEGEPVFAWVELGTGQTVRSSVLPRARAFSVVDHRRVGLELMRQARWTEAVAEWGKLLADTPADREALITRGQAYAILGRSELALDDFNSILNVDSSDAQALCLRGGTHETLGNHNQALEDLSAAIELGQSSPECYLMRGVALSNLHRHHEAIADFEKSIASDPFSYSAHWHTGLSRAALGEDLQAIRAFNRAIEIEPRSAEVYRARSLSNERLGHEDQARRDLNTAEDLEREGL